MQPQHNIPKQALESLKGFINREEELRIVKEYLKPNSRTWLTAIYGIGGIGKTTFALKVASEVYKERFFDVVVWSTAKYERFDPRKAKLVPTTPRFPPFRKKHLETLDQLLKDILKLFEVSNKRGWSIDDRLDQVHDLLKSKRTLIIIDDFDLLDEGASEDIGEFVGRTLPEPTKALVTSRRTLGIPGEASMNLYGLNLAKSRELIRARAKKWKIRAGQNMGEKDIERLHKITGGNPLALELTIGQLKKLSLQSIFDSATRLGEGFEVYQKFEDFLFETAFSQSDENSQRLWLTLAAIDKPSSEEELSKLTHLPLYALHESTDWLDSNGLIYRLDGPISLHPVANSYGNRILMTKETLSREIEEQLENIAAQTKS
jgi:hypothetical protein